MVSEEFKNNVSSGRVVRVRSALLDDLIIDKSFRMFQEDLNYASARMNVFEIHNGEPFELDTSKWDTNYLNQVKAELMVNYSEERVAHLQNVITAVLNKDNKTLKTDPSNPSSSVKAKNRTGRTVVETRIVEEPKPSNRVYMAGSMQQKPHAECQTTVAPDASTIGRTGRQTVHEEEITVDTEDSPQNTSFFNYKSALIIGGVAIAAVGVAASKAVVIGAGIAIAGAGAVLKAKDMQKK